MVSFPMVYMDLVVLSLVVVLVLVVAPFWLCFVFLFCFLS